MELNQSLKIHLHKTIPVYIDAKENIGNFQQLSPFSS